MTTPNALAIGSHGDLERIAKMAAASGICTVKRWEEAAYLLATGYELGLSPMQSLRGIYVVNGKPVLSADLLVAIVRRSGFCEWWRTVESTPDRCTISTLRKGDPEPATKTWTMADAKRAGLAGKPIWTQYPATMLRHRCAAELAREAYTDVTLGLYDPEELGAEGDRPGERSSRATPREPIDADAPALPPSTPSALPTDYGAPPSRAAAERPSPAAEAPIVEAPPVAMPLSANDLRAMLAELTSATDLAALRAAWKGMADDEKRGTEEQRAALLDAATKRKAVFAEEARLREERKAAADAEPPPDGPAKPPRGPRKPRTPVATPDATGGGAEGADGPVDAPGARSSSGHPMTTRAERRAHLATLPLAETVRLSWRHRAAMPPPGYREDCALRVCALTRGFGVDDALAYLDAAPLRVVAPEPKTRAA